jgi:hypothetical protein
MNLKLNSYIVVTKLTTGFAGGQVDFLNRFYSRLNFSKLMFFCEMRQVLAGAARLPKNSVKHSQRAYLFRSNRLFSEWFVSNSHNDALVPTSFT